MTSSLRYLHELTTISRLLVKHNQALLQYVPALPFDVAPITKQRRSAVNLQHRATGRASLGLLRVFLASVGAEPSLVIEQQYNMLLFTRSFSLDVDYMCVILRLRADRRKKAHAKAAASGYKYHCKQV